MPNAAAVIPFASSNVPETVARAVKSTVLAGLVNAPLTL